MLDGITAGSLPSPIYYVAPGPSALIATLGLLANSPATVIAAMLVSLLRTPILGISVGLARGDLRLLPPALIAEFAGVLLVLALSALLGTPAASEKLLRSHRAKQR